MGDGGSTSGLVLFVASLAIAGLVSAAVVSSVAGLSNDLTRKGRAVSAGLLEDVEIINDPTSVSNDPTLIYVKNTGQAKIEPTDLTVLMDGAYRTFTATLLGGATGWKPATVVQLEITGLEAAGDHLVRVVTPSGHAEDFRYTV